MPPKDALFDTEQERLTRAQRLLPTWFVSRMMTDVWPFGLLLSDGTLMCIEQIRDVRLGADGVYLDVILMDAPPPQAPSRFRWLWAPITRTRASLANRAVMAAFELADR